MAAKLPKISNKSSSDEWVLDKFYRKFGNEEFFTLMNENSGKVGIWWKENIRNIDKGVISNDEFREFIEDLEKRRPKRYEFDEFGASLIRVMSLFGPVTYEMEEEYKLIKSENVKRKSAQQL